MNCYYEYDFINKYENHKINPIVKCYELYIKKEVFYALLLHILGIIIQKYLLKYSDTIESPNMDRYEYTWSIIILLINVILIIFNVVIHCYILMNIINII